MNETKKLFYEAMDNRREHMAKIQADIDLSVRESGLEEPLYYIFLMRVAMRKLYENLDDDSYSQAVFDLMTMTADETDQDNIELN
jgi:hypothetical protein